MLDEKIQWPPAGRYVVAVSGGADSVALLRLMVGAAGERGYDLVVAHFDHRMRPDSAADADFVAALAAGLDLPVRTGRAETDLTSEARARAARYNWLRSIQAEVGARAILTAHHQDDLIETSLLNLARGSGWRGIAPLRASGVIRPLLSVTRADLRRYLSKLDQAFVEDPTNQDIANPRNLLRHRLLAVAPDDWSERYTTLIAEIGRHGAELERAAELIWHPVARRSDPAGSKPKSLETPRDILTSYDLDTVAALVAQVADRLRPGVQLRRRTVDEGALFIVTGRSGQTRDLGGGLTISIKALMVRVSFGFTTLSEPK